ncbi:MAG: 3-deoxy-8-phosphooctulonate synthase [Acidobacteria bacterium]|nr:3-deoxy-8-phosphooctulonate synthase [Acidobacteriota bacterium]
MSQFYKNIYKQPSLIAGPCVWEGYEHAVHMVENLLDICVKYDINFIYKTSFDKANRTSGTSFRGAERAIEGFGQLKKDFGIEILSDVHEPWQTELCRNVDILQVPALLCRQTDLIRAVAKTGKPVNVKKGQFLSPHEMKYVAEKLRQFGCTEAILTERGTSFGYNNLVVDFRSIPIMREHGFPVCIDATHSVQMPGGNGDSSGGDRSFAKYMMRCGMVCGADVVFAEVHNDPDNAPSDGPNMLELKYFEEFVKELSAIGYDSNYFRDGVAY